MAIKPERVDRYVRGEFDEPETLAFESELLESPQLQDALEAALGLKRVVELERQQLDARATERAVSPELKLKGSSHWQNWAMAASVMVAAIAVTLLWRSAAENVTLHSRVTELSRPVGTVLTVPVDIMRSMGAPTPDVRIRKPAGAALLILDVEVVAQMANAQGLELLLSDGEGSELSRWTATSARNGRIQIALRTELLPDGMVSLRISDPVSGVSNIRLLELLPAEKP
jgi:hypothetical protein